MRSPMHRLPPVAQQMVRYLLVGGSAFVIDFGSLALLKSGLGVPAWLSAAIAFALSTIYSFMDNASSPSVPICMWATQRFATASCWQRIWCSLR